MVMNANPPRTRFFLALLLTLGVAWLARPSAIAQESGDPAKEPPGHAAPKDPEARSAWIMKQVELVRTGDPAERKAAITSLAKADKDGDCIHPLIALMAENKKDTALLVAIIRGLGRNGLVLAAPAIADQLTHKKKAVRGNAAVSLEYIGGRDPKVLAALRKHAAREKDAAIANHAYRALGRCGVKDSKVRALLLRKALGAKSEFASYGPCIGLAYFEKDEKVARGVEKLLMKIGVPGGGKQGGDRRGLANAVKRSLVSWTLANVGDPKSANFVIDTLIAGLEHSQAPWAEGLRRFWNDVARVCDGEKERMPFVEGGVRGAVGFIKRLNPERYGAETRSLMDEYRKGRESAGFRPKGDHILNDERRFRGPRGS